MKLYQPLVLQKLHIRVPDVHVRQLAVHRHLPETTSVRPHAHPFCQCLLYLSGQGRQQIGDALWPVRAGTLAFLPLGVSHAFHREGKLRPIALTIDFDWQGGEGREAQVVPLPFGVLHEARHDISAIAHLQRQRKSGAPLMVSSVILKLLDELLGMVERSLTASLPQVSSLQRKVEAALGRAKGMQLSLQEVAQASGYQHDYLNRMLKQQAGLTLGQLRADRILKQAQAWLPRASSISEVAEELGFGDPNYFARWFRKQTGVSPSVWRRAMTRL